MNFNSNQISYEKTPNWCHGICRRSLIWRENCSPRIWYRQSNSRTLTRHGVRSWERQRQSLDECGSRCKISLMTGHVSHVWEDTWCLVSNAGAHRLYGMHGYGAMRWTRIRTRLIMWCHSRRRRWKWDTERDDDRIPEEDSYICHEGNMRVGWYARWSIHRRSI